MKDQTNYNKLIGRIGEEYYFLDYTFDHGSFKGAMASVMRPVTIEEAQDRRDNWDEDGYLWRWAVADERTELGREEWVKWVLSIDGDDAVFDLSYYHYQKALLDKLDPERETYELVECIGGGRCFSRHAKWDELFAPELWEKITKFES